MEGDLATHFVNGTSDLMTPPDVLLSEWLVKSKEYTRTRKEVNRGIGVLSTEIVSMFPGVFLL